eukprot:7306122-Pyramimonas_sp.AAC.2
MEHSFNTTNYVLLCNPVRFAEIRPKGSDKNFFVFIGTVRQSYQPQFAFTAKFIYRNCATTISQNHNCTYHF